MTTIYEDDLRDSASIGAILAQIIEAKLEKQENIAKLSFKPSNDPLVHSQVSTLSLPSCTGMLLPGSWCESPLVDRGCNSDDDLP
jgi:hypothetical protein